MAETTNLNEDVSHSWIHCPPEILNTIFMKLDNKSLLTCLSVSQQWRAIADYIIQTHRDWKTLAEENMVCGGVTFKRKSKLDWKNIYTNSLLWQKLNKADILHVFTYSEVALENLNILVVNVYKDNLILVTSSGVYYYDIETYSFKKKVEILSCIDFIESDHIIITSHYMAHIESLRPLKYIYLFGKNSIDDDSRSLQNGKHISRVLFYKLEEDACYILNYKNTLWQHTWDGKSWNGHLRARYFNNDRCIVSLHVHRDQVYIFLNSGQILLNDVNSMCFNFVVNLQYNLTETSPCPVMFGTYSIVCGVPSYEDAEPKFIDYLDNFLMVCPGLSCATEHGHVLFLGFETGQVKIFIWIRQGKEKPYTLERTFNIREFDKNTIDIKIITLNVYEDKNRHHLFIGTWNCVYQVLLSYCNTEVF